MDKKRTREKEENAGKDSRAGLFLIWAYLATIAYFAYLVMSWPVLQTFVKKIIG